MGWSGRLVTDGTGLGATLDRNTCPALLRGNKDDFVIMASEVGAVDIDPEDIVPRTVTRKNAC